MAPSRSNPKLKRLYLRWNNKYFGGTLPPDTIVCYADGRSDPEYADARKRRKYGAWHFREKNPTVITIGKWLRREKLWNEIYSTLLHEMNHLYLGARVNHGEVFKQGMRRLAVLGALDDIF